MSNGLQPSTSHAGAPTINDGELRGFVTFSGWRDTSVTPHALYLLVDPTPGAAFWIGPLMSNLTQEPDFIAASTGFVNGKAATPVTVFGRRAAGWNSTALYGDVSNYLDTTQDSNNTVVLGTTYYVRSSSVADTNTGPGTGAQTVRIVYLDAAGAIQSTTVALNGTTGVSIGNTIAYVQWMEVASVGSSTTAVGNITISTVVGAPTTAQTVEYIQAGGARSRSGRYKIPTGYTAFLHTWDVSAVGNNQDAYLRATVFTNDRSLSTVFHSVDNIYLAGGSGLTNLLLHYVAIPAGAEVKASSIPTAAGAGNRLDVTIQFLLVAN